jgi:hypothetical protein
MESGTEQGTDVLAVAAKLKRWTDDVPTWDPHTSERWDAFADRHHRAERALEGRLNQLPGCELWMDGTSIEVKLTLAGVCAQSRAGLVGACQAWAAKASRQTT